MGLFEEKEQQQQSGGSVNERSRLDENAVTTSRGSWSAEDAISTVSGRTTDQPGQRVVEPGEVRIHQHQLEAEVGSRTGTAQASRGSNMQVRPDPTQDAEGPERMSVVVSKPVSWIDSCPHSAILKSRKVAGKV
jgi:hypothetical protein